MLASHGTQNSHLNNPFKKRWQSEVWSFMIKKVDYGIPITILQQNKWIIIKKKMKIAGPIMMQTSSSDTNSEIIKETLP